MEPKNEGLVQMMFLFKLGGGFSGASRSNPLNCQGRNDTYRTSKTSSDLPTLPASLNPTHN